MDGADVPRDLFDTVAENLIENARYKQSIDPDVSISVQLSADEEVQRLRVCDSGEPLPAEMARGLFDGAVQSSGGLGVGLYQCARLARHLGYELGVESNERGRVCFLLEGPAQEPSP